MIFLRRDVVLQSAAPTHDMDCTNWGSNLQHFIDSHREHGVHSFYEIYSRKKIQLQVRESILISL